MKGLKVTSKNIRRIIAKATKMGKQNIYLPPPTIEDVKKMYNIK